MNTESAAYSISLSVKTLPGLKLVRPGKLENQSIEGVKFHLEDLPPELNYCMIKDCIIITDKVISWGLGHNSILKACHFDYEGIPQSNSNFHLNINNCLIVGNLITAREVKSYEYDAT